jgi:hypothetical protein
MNAPLARSSTAHIPKPRNVQWPIHSATDRQHASRSGAPA